MDVMECNRVAVAYGNQGDYRRAIATLDDGLRRLSPTDPLRCRLLSNKAWLCLGMSRTGECADDADDAFRDAMRELFGGDDVGNVVYGGGVLPRTGGNVLMMRTVDGRSLYYDEDTDQICTA